MNYHGHEYPFIGWNELTKYPNSTLFDKMMSVNRSVRGHCYCRTCKLVFGFNLYSGIGICPGCRLAINMFGFQKPEYEAWPRTKWIDTASPLKTIARDRLKSI